MKELQKLIKYLESNPLDTEILLNDFFCTDIKVMNYVRHVSTHPAYLAIPLLESFCRAYKPDDPIVTIGSLSIDHINCLLEIDGCAYHYVGVLDKEDVGLVRGLKSLFIEKVPLDTQVKIIF